MCTAENFKYLYSNLCTGTRDFRRAIVFRKSAAAVRAPRVRDGASAEAQRFASPPTSDADDARRRLARRGGGGDRGEARADIGGARAEPLGELDGVRHDSFGGRTSTNSSHMHRLAMSYKNQPPLRAQPAPPTHFFYNWPGQRPHGTITCEV